MKIKETFLHKVIKESIESTLNKENNLYHTIADNIEYGDTKSVPFLIKAIEDGKLDDDKDFLLELTYNLGGDCSEEEIELGKAAEERLLLIDKKYVWNYCNWNDRKKRDEIENMDYRIHGDSNRNINNSNYYHPAMNDSYYRKEEMKKYPHVFTKKGEMRKNPNMDLDLYGTDRYDKGPIHRSGSLNRELDENKTNNKMKIKESQLRSIIKESISKILLKESGDDTKTVDESDYYEWGEEFFENEVKEHRIDIGDKDPRDYYYDLMNDIVDVIPEYTQKAYCAGGEGDYCTAPYYWTAYYDPSYEELEKEVTSDFEDIKNDKRFVTNEIQVKILDYIKEKILYVFDTWN